jgi:hypothetical protein
MEERFLIIGNGTEASWELMAHLAKIIPIHENIETPGWDNNIIKKYPTTGKFWVQGMKRNLSFHSIDVRMDAVPPAMLEMRAPIEPFLTSIATGIGVICSAGGTAIFVDILKTWVEGKKGRRIKIKKGDFEIEIEGFVTPKEMEQLIDTFDKHFSKQTILRP